jgi:hypothetical protein
MTFVRRLFAVWLLFVLGAASASAVPPPYPANSCVGSKQREAGRYCKAALLAWSRWEINQNTAARDASIQSAAAELVASWGKAETKSLARGTDCADTTLSAAAAQALIDAGIGGVVSQINAGLDLGRARDTQCGKTLLNAAARKCSALLGAESKHIANLAKDADGARRAAAVADAASRFGATFARRVAAGCPITSSEGDVEAAVDAIQANVVRDTIISPNVDDTQFTT